MESGFKRLFLRKSKSKPLLISAPLQDTLRPTAAYDEFVAGPPPTIGTWPLKPSQQKVTRQSSYHIRTKSVGSQEFSYAVRTDLNARPRTAAGIRSRTDLSQPPRSWEQKRVFRDERPMRSKTPQAPPTVATSPKVLAEIGGPKYFDLLQAAVSLSNAKGPPEPSQVSLDIYNEKIADRNSMYGKPPRPSVKKDVVKGSLSTHGDKEAASPQAAETQHAISDAVRASRSVSKSAVRAITENTGAEMPQSLSTIVKGSIRLGPESRKKEESSLSDWVNATNVLPPITRSESDQLERHGTGEAVPLPQRSRTLHEQSSPGIPEGIRPSLLDGGQPRQNRKRPNTLTTTPTHNNVPSPRQNRSSALPTFKPVEDGLDRSAAADSSLASPISYSSSKNHSVNSSRDLTLATQPHDLAPDHVSSRLISDISPRKYEGNKRDEYEGAIPPRNISSDRMLSVKSLSRDDTTSSGRVVDRRAQDPGRRPDKEEDDDYDVGIEDAVTQCADPIQILRAAIVTADGYVYRGRDNIILGKVLDYPPSRGLPQTQNTHFKAALRSPLDSHKRSLVTSNSAQTSLNRAREPAEGRPELARSKYRQIALPSERSLSPLQPSKARDPHLTEPTTGSSSRPVFPSVGTTPVISQPYKDILPTHHNGVSVPSEEAVTRGLAHAQIPLSVFPTAAMQRPQSSVDGITTLGGRRNGNNVVGQEVLGCQNFEPDRSIAVKKEDAAKAFLKLQEVMATPTREERCNAERAKVSTRPSDHWTDISMGCSSSIAPVNQWTTPVLTPPLSRRSTFSAHAEPDLSPSLENPKTATTEKALASSPQAFLNTLSLSQAQTNDLVTNAANPELPEPTRLARMNGSFTDPTIAKGHHSRIGSAVSPISGKNAYSLPYHMVPARGSSMRDSLHRIADCGN